MIITAERCKWCDEDPRRDAKFLVELPGNTRKQHLKVRVCPFCDGDELVELAYRETPNEQT